MHECPFCGEVCDCDMDDTWGLPIPDDCPHIIPYIQIAGYSFSQTKKKQTLMTKLHLLYREYHEYL